MSVQICRLLLLVALLVPALLCVIGSSKTFEDDNDEDRLFHEGIQDGHEQTSQESAKSSEPLPKDKLLLSQVKTLTFIRNKRTTSRRTHTIHQLSCVGGTAGCKLFTPNVVECHNDGLEKTTGKVKWRCQADMSDRVQFNHVEVICEGYDYPEDDYILMGSCGLEFTLDYTDPHDYHDQSYFKHMDEHERTMHHERVRGQNKPPKTSKLSVIFQWLYVQASNYSTIIIILFVLLIILTLVRSGLYSGAGATAATSNLKNKRQPPLSGGGGIGAGYGQLTSAVLTTKKAC